MSFIPWLTTLFAISKPPFLLFSSSLSPKGYIQRGGPEHWLLTRDSICVLDTVSKLFDKMTMAKMTNMISFCFHVFNETLSKDDSCGINKHSKQIGAAVGLLKHKR